MDEGEEGRDGRRNKRERGWMNEGRDVELQLLNEPQQRTPEDKLTLNQYDKVNEFTNNNKL